MDKLKLTLEDLVVESFASAENPERPGTVFAQGSGPYTDECDSCAVGSDCWGGACDTPSCYCPPDTNSCYGWETCEGAYTCGGVESCVWPQCTAGPYDVC